MNYKKLLIPAILLLLFIPLFCGCSSENASSDAESSLDSVSTFSGDTEYPVTVKDLNGEVTIEKEPTRIVSLSPSNTETLFALGAQDRQVGRTDYDNYPPEAASIPSIGSYSSPSVEQILAQTPDLVVASDYIDENIKAQLEATGAKVLVFGPTTVKGVEEYIASLGQAVNANDKATELIDSIQKQYQELGDKLGTIEERKTVFLDIGDYYTAGPGSLLNDELELIQAENIAADTDSAYPQLSVETIIADNPDVYISMYTPIEELKKVGGFDSIKAFQDNQVYFYDGLSTEADKIKRPGPRIVEGMELLAKDIYPDKFETASNDN